MTSMLQSDNISFETNNVEMTTKTIFYFYKTIASNFIMPANIARVFNVPLALLKQMRTLLLCKPSTVFLCLNRVYVISCSACVSSPAIGC